jgi:zinc/manganese transport system substrate-binding protein
MQVERLDIPQKVDRSLGDVHASGNPHVQTDPRRLLTIADALSQRLQLIDAGHADAYVKRFADFKARWLSAMERWQQRAAPLRGVRVVTHHKDWTYLLDWLGMEAVATLEPKPGVPPSAAHLAALKRQLQEQPAVMVIRSAYQDARPSEWLAEQADIPAVLLPFTVGGSDRAGDLFGLFDDTIDRLLSALP